jgi:carbamoyl-phosphate synthase large subunit
VPYVSKATGLPLAKIAARCMTGKRLAAQGVVREIRPAYFSVKEAVFPFSRFPGVDTILGPEMKSTGEVMGIDRSFGLAFAKSQIAAGQRIPLSGTVFISVKDEDKPDLVDTAASFHKMGFKIVATRGTSAFLSDHGIPNEPVNKVREGRPHIVDMIKNREIQMVINTTATKKAVAESYSIRRTALTFDVPYTTTVAGAKASALAIQSMIGGEMGVKTLQEYHRNRPAEGEEREVPLKKAVS